MILRFMCLIQANKLILSWFEMYMKHLASFFKSLTCRNLLLVKWSNLRNYSKSTQAFYKKEMRKNHKKLNFTHFKLAEWSQLLDLKEHFRVKRNMHKSWFLMFMIHLSLFKNYKTISKRPKSFRIWVMQLLSIYDLIIPSNH